MSVIDEAVYNDSVADPEHRVTDEPVHFTTTKLVGQNVVLIPNELEKLPSLITLRQLRWRLRKYLPQILLPGETEVFSDPSKILLDHIEQVSHLRETCLKTPSANRISQSDEKCEEKEFVLLDEEDEYPRTSPLALYSSALRQRILIYGGMKPRAPLHLTSFQCLTCMSR
ncbi:hypothetical protein Aperf_G00000015740 [Anoplocephala perfoliata]